NGNNQLGHNGDGPLIGSSDAKLLGRSKSFSKLDNTVFCHNQRFSISFLDGNHLLNGFVCGMDRVFTMSADLSIYVTLETDLSNHNQYPSTAIFDVQQDKLCADQHGMIFYTLTSDDYILQRTLTSDWQYLDKMGTKKCSVMNCDETGNVFCTSSNTIYVWSVETSSFWTHLYDLWGQQFFKPLNNNRTQFCIVEQLPGKEVNYTVIAYKPGK
uniref:Uncharacterized protein n=1 Tax=Clytia hemisphaerica TaxID=252671 RepID=A0A7M5X9F6_9CNID